MKNSLELEVALNIEKGNILLQQKKYTQAVQKYSQCLKMYSQNLAYNSTVSLHFQHVLYSLRGLAYTYILNEEERQLAEKDFNYSLKLNPLNATTLSRRAQLYIQQRRYLEAIQDIKNVLICQPENCKHLETLALIEKNTQQINNEQEREQILKYLKSTSDANQIVQEDEDLQMLNFSNLRLIDRVSVRINDLSLQKKKSIVSFKEDEVINYQSDNQDPLILKEKKFSKQEVQLKLKQQQVEILQEKEQQEEQKMIINLKAPIECRKSILRRSYTTNEEHTSIKQNDREVINVANIKDIDGKIIAVCGETVKFRTSKYPLSQFNPNQSAQGKFQPRKSCLRLSRVYSDFPELEMGKKKSSFLDIKNIDGTLLKSTDSLSQQKNQILQDSDSDDEHNIFGKSQEQKAMYYLGKMTTNQKSLNKSNLGISTLGKKKSILKKQSIQNPPLNDGWKLQKKKSVCFQTN